MSSSILYTIYSSRHYLADVVDELTPCDAFLTGNSTGELYTVNAITCCSPAKLCYLISSFDVSIKHKKTDMLSVFLHLIFGQKLAFSTGKLILYQT